VAFLSTKSPAADAFLQETEAPARALGIQLLSVLIQGPDDFESAFRTMTKAGANGLVNRLQPDAYAPHYKRVAELTTKNRLPSISSNGSWSDAGGLMSYGSELKVQHRRAAAYVDKILKGTSPADLPIEAPMKFEFAINLKTAKQLGLTIPPNVLARADRVIR
jgi:putative ABC transport system substrate-binding protein